MTISTVNDALISEQPTDNQQQAFLEKDEICSLVLATQRGEQYAFEELYRRTHSSIRRLIATLLPPSCPPDDLVQEVYVLVWSKIWALREPATFWTWLRRIAVHLTLRRQDQHRKKGWDRVVNPDKQATQQPAVDSDPAASVPKRLDLADSLARLPHKDRALLILREVHGYPYEEMAEILNIPVGTVRSRLHSARKKILNQLQEQGAMS